MCSLAPFTRPPHYAYAGSAPNNSRAEAVAAQLALLAKRCVTASERIRPEAVARAVAVRLDDKSASVRSAAQSAVASVYQWLKDSGRADDPAAVFGAIVMDTAQQRSLKPRIDTALAAAERTQHVREVASQARAAAKGDPVAIEARKKAIRDRAQAAATRRMQRECRDQGVGAEDAQQQRKATREGGSAPPPLKGISSRFGYSATLAARKPS